jgi:hypothetical protein
MLLDTFAGGGLRMVREPMTSSMLKVRLAQDSNIPSLRARCEPHVQLFLQANAGADVWSETEYQALSFLRGHWKSAVSAAISCGGFAEASHHFCE